MSKPDRFYDLTNLKKMVGDEESSIKNFVEMFLKLSATTLVEINNSYEAKDYVKMGTLAHKLKASIDLMGIIELKEDIRSIEKNGKNEENLADLPVLIEKLNFILDEVFIQLKDDFN